MTDLEYRKAVSDFISDTVSAIEHPHCWPLTPQEQAQFIRSTCVWALKLKNTEQFRRGNVFLAVEQTKKGGRRG